MILCNFYHESKFTSSVIVAENNIVCLPRGLSLTISSIWSLKFSSSILRKHTWTTHHLNIPTWKMTTKHMTLLVHQWHSNWASEQKNCLFLYPSVHLSIIAFVCLSFCLSTCLSVYLSVSKPVCWFVLNQLSVCHSVMKSGSRTVQSVISPLICLFVKQTDWLVSLVYLSASSRTIISTVCRLNEGVLCRWSTSLPGVAITMSGPFLNAASWTLLSKPPAKNIISSWT